MGQASWGGIYVSTGTSKTAEGGKEKTKRVLEFWVGKISEMGPNLLGWELDLSDCVCAARLHKRILFLFF